MGNEKLIDKLAVKEIKTQSDYLADNIKKMIIDREFEDGYVFPNETEFCKMLNVSRATLREAYKILNTQGYIKRTKHGTSVRRREDIARDGNFTTSVELADRREVWEFVSAIEPAAAYLAAQKAQDKPDKLAELEALQKECEDSADDWRMLMKANGRFHDQIRNMADNTLITSSMQAYYEVFNKQIVEEIYYSGGSDVKSFRDNSLAQHRELVKAIKEGRADDAKRIAGQHLADDIEFKRLDDSNQ